MSGPIWMASPPEVHSALLSSGPGAQSLLAAAGAWESLSQTYASAAEELGAQLAAVQTGVWQGPSAESYVAANLPYLAWLMQASANSAAAAASHETVAAAYTAAVTAMPTLAELAANHAVHSVLVATNFFGINTIPIALNEADYARMWVQAATTMATYHTVCDAAVASTPQTDPPPQIVKANSAAAGASGGSQDGGPGPDSLSWYTTRISDVVNAIQSDLANSQSDAGSAVAHLLTDPVLTTLVPHWAGEAISVLGPQIGELTALSYGLIAPFAPAAGVTGLAGLAGLSQSAPAPMPALPEETSPAALSQIGPGAAAAPTFAAPVAIPAALPTTVPAPGTVAAAAPPAVPAGPSSGTASFVPPYAVGPPDVGFGSRLRVSARTNASQSDSVAAVAAPSTRERAQARRRRRAKHRQLGRGYQYLELGPDIDAASPGLPDVAEVAVPEPGAGAAGFSATAGKAGVIRAAGLTTMPRDTFSADPTMPMVPGTWHPDPAGQTDKEDAPRCPGNA
jgi:PPE-repeat protein